MDIYMIYVLVGNMRNSALSVFVVKQIAYARFFLEQRWRCKRVNCAAALRKCGNRIFCKSYDKSSELYAPPPAAKVLKKI